MTLSEEQFVYAICNILSVFSYVEYARLWEKQDTKWIKRVNIFILTYLVDIIVYFNTDLFSPNIYVLSSLIIMVFLIYYFSRSIRVSIVYAFAWVCIGSMGEIISGCVISLINHQTIENMLSNSFTYFEIVFMSRVFQLLVVSIFSRLIKKRKLNQKFTIRFVSLICVLFGTLISMAWYLRIIYKYKVVTELSEFMMILMIMIVTDIIVYILYEKQERVIEIQAQNQALRQYIDAQQIEYQHHMEITEKERIIRHDMKNYMLLLKSYALEQDTHKIIELVDEKFNKLEYEREQIHTGNKYLDIILSNKIRMAESQNIKVSTDIQTLGVIHIDSEDLIVMIGNLFDNAIEAATQCVEKKIEIMIRFEKQMFVFSINNSVSKPVVLLKGGEIRSTKKEPGHGIGIPSVHRLAMKYDGDLTLSNKDNMFYVKLVLFDKGE